MSFHSPSTSERIPNWQLWTGAALAVATILFGGWGLWRYESTPDGHPNVFSILYHTLQLFILHAPHLDHPVPWQLHLGRWLGVIFTFGAVAKAFGKIFRDEFLLMRLRLPMRRPHVVVCGLGDLGLRLALAARKDRRFVVAIEKNPTAEALAQAREKKVLVIEGDARKEDQLRRAQIQRAQFLMAACESDFTNVAIATVAGELVQGKNSRVPLTCQLLLQNQALQSLLSEDLFKREGSDYHVNANDLEFETTAARQVFRDYPLDFEPIHPDDDTEVQLVVIGFGKMGQRLARQAARIGHFANEVGPLRKRLSLIVVDPVDTAWNEFQVEFPKLQKVCNASLLRADPRSAGTAVQLAGLCSGSGKPRQLVTYAFCVEDGADKDLENMRLGLDLAKQITNAPAQVLIRQSSNGYAALFPETGTRGSAICDRIHAFGMEDEVFGWDGLFYEENIACAMHEEYRASAQDTNHKNWWDLSPSFKDSNRQAADHILVKLRAIDCEVSRRKWLKRSVKKFDHDQIDVLAQLEHARWCSERYLDGWDRGPTDRARKISDSLKPWEDLTQEEKKKDWNQIQAIPKILNEEGFYIYKK